MHTLPSHKLHRGWHAALVLALALCAPLGAVWLANAATPRPAKVQDVAAPLPPAHAAASIATAALPASIAPAAAPVAAPAAQPPISESTLPPTSGDPLAAAEAMALVNARSSQMVLAAVQYLGIPYRWGGKTESGFDCSGLTRAVVLRATGMELPMNAAGQAHVTRPVPFDELRGGDLVFFNTRGHIYSHVGVYVGDGFFIHAPHSGAVVRIEDMRQEKWMRRLTGTHRLPLMRPVQVSPAAPAASAASAMLAAATPSEQKNLGY